RRFRLRETLSRLATAMMRCKPCPEPRLRIASNFHG
ncbi:IS1595 family transposase, partial [Pseudoxanthomonas winnipegensis]